MLWELVVDSICFREAQASESLDNVTATDDFFSLSDIQLFATLVTSVAFPLSYAGCETCGRRTETDVDRFVQLPVLNTH